MDDLMKDAPYWKSSLKSMSRKKYESIAAVGSSCGSDSKESSCNAGDACSIPGFGRSPGEGISTHSSILTWKIPWTVAAAMCSHTLF